VNRMAAAGSPATGVGGMYYMILFAVSIILRLYRNNTSRINNKRISKIVSSAVVTVYLIVIISTLQAFKIINIGETLNHLFTTFNILF
ncbi:MAG TPA: hypothetical protein VL854_05175, partial [Nitrososphaeraceae archaeon]|nr:hypothetical protein [Nitrososphaeraceae archaeon]